MKIEKKNGDYKKALTDAINKESCIDSVCLLFQKDDDGSVYVEGFSPDKIFTGDDTVQFVEGLGRMVTAKTGSLKAATLAKEHGVELPDKMAELGAGAYVQIARMLLYAIIHDPAYDEKFSKKLEKEIVKKIKFIAEQCEDDLSDLFKTISAGGDKIDFAKQEPNTYTTPGMDSDDYRDMWKKVLGDFDEETE